MPRLLYKIQLTGYAVGENADDALENFCNEADMTDLDSESKATRTVLENWKDVNPYGDWSGKSCAWWAEETRLHVKLMKERICQKRGKKYGNKHKIKAFIKARLDN